MTPSFDDQIAVCNLASINLSIFAQEDTHAYDFEGLYRISKVVTRNLNKIIDVNFYPVAEARTSNLRHRPIGIGVQGLADAFIKMRCVCVMMYLGHRATHCKMLCSRFPFDSPEAIQLNKDIFETIYYGAVEASIDLAARDGPYDSYAGSPASRGVLQYDMWGVTPSSRWDWAALKQRLAQHGMRNSLLLAPMPTASTAQILGNNEATEPFTSNMYTRRVLAGEFTVVNKYLLRDLVQR